MVAPVLSPPSFPLYQTSSPSTMGIGGGSGCGVNTTPITNPASGGTVRCQVRPVQVQANSMGVHGQLDIQFSVSMTNNANNKLFAITFGGQYVYTPTYSNISTFTGTVHVRNAGATNSQIVTVLAADGSSSSSFITTSVDTTISQPVVFWVWPTQTNDVITLSGYNVETSESPSPRVYNPLFVNAKTFYGVNSHPAYENTGVSPAQQIALMKFLGCTVLRLDWEGNNSAQLIAYAQAFQADGTGLQVCCTLGNTSMNSSGSTAYASEAAAYAGNYTNGFNAAQALIPYGVVMYEAANELDASSAGSTQMRTPTVSVQGSVYTDYNLSIYPLFRGACNGATDGLRAAAVAAGVKILVASNAFTQSSIALSDALWSGTNPDGSPGGQPCRWDITNWHTYTNGTLMGGSCTYSGFPAPSFNLLDYVQSAYGVPIFITEFNPSTSNDSMNATTTTAWLTAWYAAQQQYNIAGVMFYDLFDQSGSNPFYQMFITDGGPWATSNMTLNGQAYYNFIQTNPALR